MQPQKSTIHIYVSAPGDDLATERRLLADLVLPELRSRATGFGITVEVMAHEDTLAGRLSALAEQRPLFVAFLGQRMGPQAVIPDEFLTAFPWLRQWQGHSAREVELVFAQHHLDRRCVVYRREPQFIDAVPEPQRAAFLPSDAAEAARASGILNAIGCERYRFDWNARDDPGAALPGLAERIVEDLWAMIGPAPQAVTEPIDVGYGAGAAPRDVPLPFHDDVQFTVYRPRVAPVGQWTPLLAFAHLGNAPLGSAPDDDPLVQVERRAQAVLGDRLPRFASVRQDSSAGLPDEAEVTFLLDLPAAFEIRAPRRTFLWVNSVHMEEFAIRAGPHADGRTLRGALSVFHGSILLAEVPLTISVGAVPASDAAARVPVTAAPFRNIFPSYSHLDASIVEEFEAYAEASGDRFLRDVRELRSGEIWSERLCDFIRDADVFQLFWSDNSMRSRYVEQEWRYALALRRPAFVRPTFWQQPMPPAPDELRQFHFHFAGGPAFAGGPVLAGGPVAQQAPPVVHSPAPPQPMAPPSYQAPGQWGPPPIEPSAAGERRGRSVWVLVGAVAAVIVIVVLLILLT